MRFLYKSPPESADVLRITVLGVAVARRDTLVAALAMNAANTGATHHVTTQTGGDLTLLLGLSGSDALPVSPACVADQSLRRQLNDAHQPYQVLYGELSEQLAQAVRILHIHPRTKPSDSAQNPPTPTQASNWRWACDKCSDPACEHRLLTDLLAQRQPPA